MAVRLHSNKNEKDPQKTQMRQKFFQESKFDSARQKFGLFSFNGTLAVGKSSYDPQKEGRRDAQGAVRLAPRNFTTSPVKRGRGNEAFFSTPSFITVGDPYRDSVRPQRAQRDNSQRMRKVHGASFRSTGPFRFTEQQEYVPQGTIPRQKKRDQQGNVVLQPRNFYTSPPKKGMPRVTPGTTFDAFPQYLDQPYERKRDMQRKELLQHQNKLRGPFTGISHTGEPFDPITKVYGQQGLPPSKPKKLPRKPAVCAHQKPFFPTNNTKTTVIDSSFQAFPEHMPDPEPKVVRKAPEEKVPFKYSGIPLTKPSPTIISNKINIKREFNLKL